MTEELKSCPLCGDNDPDAGSDYVQCLSCLVIIHHDTRAEAIAAWNQRANTGAVDELVKTLERIANDDCMNPWEEAKNALSALEQKP